MSQEEDIKLGEPPSELRGDITWQAVVVGILVAIIMGLSYPYMVLKLGFGPNVSVVAAFFGFLFLRAIDLLMGKRTFTRWQNNLAEAAGTSAAQTAFMCVLLGAFDLLQHHTAKTSAPFHMEITPITSFIWLTVACTLGVLMAVPLRRHFVVDEKLPYVDGLSAAATITVLDPPHNANQEVRRNAFRALWAVMGGVVVSGFIMALQLGHLAPEAWKVPWVLREGTAYIGGKNEVTGLVLATFSVGIAFSVLSVGSGMLVGLRVTASMLIGGTLAWIIAPYFLMEHGVPLHRETYVEGGVQFARMVYASKPTKDEILFWVMWPATGMMVAGGLTALALRWRLLVETFRSLRGASIGSTEFPLRIVIPGVVVCAVALCVVQYELLGLPIWMTALAIVMSVPLMLVGLRVLGETNWGPISAVSNMMQGLFAVIAPGNVAANMVASGTTGTIATSSEAIMQDYKCGHMVGTRPRNLTIMQLMAVPIGAAAVSWIYPRLVEAYRIVPVIKDGKEIPPDLSSPISIKWAGFAQLLQDGVSSLHPSALYALLIFSALGVLLTVLESNKKLKPWIPSPTGIGIGILVPFMYVFTMFLGAVAGRQWERTSPKSASVYLVPLASGLIAGEALVAVIASIIKYAIE
ncbi:MAG: OPT/YSL family transporter [Kofleriaceae bacterium]